MHTVEILVPPSVRPVPQNGQITARKGSTVSLECKASGNPVPNLYWHKKVRISEFISVIISSWRPSLTPPAFFKYLSPIWVSASKLTMFCKHENYGVHLTYVCCLRHKTSFSFYERGSFRGGVSALEKRRT